ncbi:hypothetical protein Mal4_54500 [Maioricimonas rarisocia]|uniref:Uncharacterized protein n=1 Tax=Maioricimonas rarisocia TaxID=2528026 RepID=A0A517ZF18_9PLAN|nr:hypothetical protein [Maioricimonas rarisocia]QDU41085.1 hypothetical protein Mal4_54500 [Maioricimonas rarisocia]
MADAVEPLPVLAGHEANCLSDPEQEGYLQLMLRGASPAAACLQLELPVGNVLRTMEQQPEFRERLRQVRELLSQNVAAALYRAAMEGSVSAQSFYLKNQPPPEWPQPDEADSDIDDAMSNDELLDRCRAAGLAVPPEVETLLRRPDRAPAPAAVSPADPDRPS